jgi:hypothetical protein
MKESETPQCDLLKETTSNLSDWMELASRLEKERQNFHCALVGILSQTGGGNPSHIGQDRAFSIAREALSNEKKH